MSFVSIGDLARSYSLRSHNAEIKARLDRLGEELTTGLTADTSERLRGDFRTLGAIDRSLTVMDSYDLAATEAALTTDTMQLALGRIDEAADSLTPSLLNSTQMRNSDLVDVLGSDSLSWLEMSVSALNTQNAGRSLFAGAATNGPALAPTADIMASVTAAVSGLTSAQDVMDALDTWFDTPGGGFETDAYLGSATPVGKVRLNESHSMSIDVTAADQEIREMLKGFVAGALLSDPTLLGGNLAARSDLAFAAGQKLLQSRGDLTVVMADVGVAQSRIEEIRTENASSRHLLELARVDMLGVDQYEAASQLEAAQTQLETVYTVTARLSRLSLADYL